MRKGTVYISLSLLLVTKLLHSCMFSGCEKVPFNKEDLSWIVNLPNEGDTILYKGSDETIDTFFVSTKYRGYADCNRFEMGKYQPEEFIFCMDNLNRKTYGSWYRYVNFEMTRALKENISDTASKIFRFYDLTSYYDDLVNKIEHQQIKLKYLSKTVQTIYIDHYTADVGGASFRERILNFSWNKELGLVRYLDADSVEYQYWKKY